MKILQRESRLWRCIGFIRPYRGSVALILGLTLITGALGAVEPLILKYIFDALGGGGSSALLPGVLLLVGLGLIREAFSALSNWLTWRTRLGVHFALLDASVDKIHKLPLRFHQAEGVGSLMTRLDRGIQGFLNALGEIAFHALPALLYLVISFAVMLSLDGRLALVVLVFVPLPALITAWAAPPQIQRERLLLSRWSKIYSRFQEVLSGIATVKSFAMEEEERQRFLKEVKKANQVVVSGVGFDSGVGAAQNLVLVGARVAAIACGGAWVLRGEITLGTLVAFLGYLSGLFGPVQGLSGIYRTFRTASVSIDTIFSILDARDTTGDAPDAHELGPVRGEVVFDRVSFSYEKEPILCGIDLVVKPGETVALVGPSGAGKTTMMALLQRFYEPTEGAIYVDGVDIRTLQQRSLRKQIGVVLQDALLLNDTVRNNIAYGRPGASMQEIEAAARAAYAHEFILRLPKGYETEVGERGCKLSQGERQRIAIARALLKDPPILILDEATSALDAESEALVQEALDALIRGRTTFVIAHRLSTVVNADRILVLKGGRILESGHHTTLLAAGGYYAELVKRQTRGLLAQAV